MSEKLTVLCWLWNKPDQIKYLPQYVDILANKINKHLSMPYRFVCVTSTPKKLFSSDITIIRPPNIASQYLDHLEHYEHENWPVCYRRLWIFSKEAEYLLNTDRVLAIDLDILVVSNLDSLIEKYWDKSFVGTSNNNFPCQLNGGCYLFNPSQHHDLWHQFNGALSIEQAHQAGYHGSDQAWMSYQLGSDVVCFEPEDGIRFSRGRVDDIDPKKDRIVMFNTRIKPWSKRASWCRRHYWNQK